MSTVRTMPSYDWEWFKSHAPFRRIFEKTCELEIDKEVQRIPTIAGYYTLNNHYKIKCNFAAFERDFDKIKAMLLKTNVCRHNQNVYDYVNGMENTKPCACKLILYGCIANASGSFEWNNMSYS